MLEIVTNQSPDGTWQGYCPKSTCGKSFTKPTQELVKQAVRMHYGRSHSRKIPTYVPGLAKAKPAHTETETKPKRTYTKRAKPVGVLVNFCPNCGLDLSRVALGIAISKPESTR